MLANGSFTRHYNKELISYLTKSIFFYSLEFVKVEMLIASLFPDVIKKNQQYFNKMIFFCVEQNDKIILLNMETSNLFFFKPVNSFSVLQTICDI